MERDFDYDKQIVICAWGLDNIFAAERKTEYDAQIVDAIKKVLSSWCSDAARQQFPYFYSFTAEQKTIVNVACFLELQSKSSTEYFLQLWKENYRNLVGYDTLLDKDKKWHDKNIAKTVKLDNLQLDTIIMSMATEWLLHFEEVYGKKSNSLLNDTLKELRGEK